jgi:hypothetical protein
VEIAGFIWASVEVRPAMGTVKRLWFNLSCFSFFAGRTKGEAAMNAGGLAGFCPPGWRG